MTEQATGRAVSWGTVTRGYASWASGVWLSKCLVELTVKNRLEQILKTAAAGGLGGFHLAEFGHTLGELLLKR